MIKAILHKITLLLLGALFFSCGAREVNQSSKTAINSEWKFIQKDISEAIKKDFDDTSWETVTLPHDWSISKPFSKENPSFSRGAWLPAGVSYYRKQLDLSNIGSAQKVFIHFEGAYRNAEVWINGQYLGKRPSGYAAFEYEITKHIIRDKSNVITVKLDNSEQPGSRWYSGNGIYRDVFLIVKNKVYIPTWATYVTTPKISEDETTIHLETTINNTSRKSKTVRAKVLVLNAGKKIASSEVSDIQIKANSEVVYNEDIIVDKPLLWSIENPNLYQVKVELFEDENKYRLRNSVNRNSKDGIYC